MGFTVKKLNGKNMVQELQGIGFDSSYLYVAKNKHEFLNLKIFNVNPVQATIIKQTALSAGCDCALHKGVLTHNIENSNCILSGSYSQLKTVSEKLKFQQFSLCELSNLIEENLKPEKFCGTKIMAILNANTDSFSNDFKDPILRAKEFLAQGVEIIDVGAESTRPEAEDIEDNVQIERLAPVLDFLKDKGVVISVDTRSSLVAMEAIKIGCDIINDVSFLNYDQKLLDVVIKNDKKFILTHSKGTPKTMNSLCKYKNTVDEIYLEILKKAQNVTKQGLNKENLIIDVGFGFAKDVSQNIEIIKHIDEFKGLGYTLLAGISRKRVIQNFEENKTLEEADFLTALASFYFALKKVDIVRVHNPYLTRLALKFAKSL